MSTRTFSSLETQIGIDPSAKKPKFIGSEPGVPYLTDQLFDQNAVTELETEEANGSINITVHVTRDDQQYINQNQYVFLDNSDQTKPRVLSLAQVNYALAYLQIVEGAEISGSWIMRTYQPMGTLANMDVSNRRGTIVNKPGQTHTIVTHGATQCLDYWSNEKSLIHSFSKLFFIAKKIQITNEHRFKIKIYESENTPGELIPNIIGKWVWQIVPFHTTQDISWDDISWRDGSEVGVGTYWFIGFVHEYQHVTAPSLFRLRREYETAYDVTSLYRNAEASKSIQMYLCYDNNSTKMLLF